MSSRWISSFEVHAFQSVWVELKSNLEKATVDDETILTSVQELARLKKVISLIDELVKCIDPEIVPASIWDNFHSQVVPCNQNIAEYVMNRSIGHITKANSHADNLLTYIRPYMVLPEKVVKALQSAVRTYAKTIDDYADSFVDKSNELIKQINEDKSESAQLKKNMDGILGKLEDAQRYIFGEGEANLGVKGQLEKLLSEIEQKYEEMVACYNETLVGSDKEASTKKEILQAKELAIKDSKSISELLITSKDETKALEEFYCRIYGKADEKGELTGGLRGELDLRMRLLADFEVEQSKKYKALNEEIETLLPGATSAGLASAYNDVKKSFDGPIKKADITFYVSLGVLIFASLLLSLESIGIDGVKFVEYGDWNYVLRGLVYKIPFYAPVLWLAFYATKRRSECQRLQQEYAHKEALAKSYNSYKKQLQDLGEESKDLQKELISKTIEAVAFNASSTLDGEHGDNLPAQEVMQKTIEALAKLKSM